MSELLKNKLTSGSFIPHGHCYLWQPELVWLHILSDSIIAFVYYSIAITLVYFVRQRQDLPFNQIFLLFGIFIVACGTTHLMEIWTLWHPTYWLSGSIKVLTALASAYTALELVPLVPLALALPSSAQLEAANLQLQQQITQRKLAEAALQKANAELETRVRDRTKELILANEELRTEITERQRTEESLHDEEERFEATFNSAAVGIAHVDINGKWLLVNQKLCDIVGYTQQELLGRTFQDITHPEDLDADLEYVRQMLASEIQTYSMEKRYIHKDSSLVWINLTVSLVREPTGKPKYFISIVQDISERQAALCDRQQAEAALRESEEKYRTVFNSIDEGFCVVEMLFDENGKPRDYLFLEVNPMFEQLSGLAGAMGKTARQLVPDLEEFWFKTYGRVALTGQTIWFENYSEPMNGWFNVYASRVGGADSHKVAIVFTNITERKLAEQKIREQAALLDIATDAILVRSLDNQIIFWNKAAESLYGWKAVEAIGQDADTLLYQKISPQLQEAYETVIEWGMWQGELHQVTKASKEIVVASRWTLVRDEHEQPKSILTVNTDITQQRKLEAQFQRAQRMESIGTLAGGIAHDLNNVLAPILMSVQLLQLKVSDSQTQQLLKTLETTTKRGAALVKQVLSFARGMQGDRTILQIKHLILEIVQVAKATFPKSIEFDTDIVPDLWTVYADATGLHQVILNLCVNARDAMPNGGTLSICAENLYIDEYYAAMNLDASVGSYIKITVADTGTGMTGEVIERIFEPFFTTKEFGIGTGLGLSTVMGIVKSHNGFINVYSEVGLGTRFEVYLPAAEKTAIGSAENLVLPKGNGELILVVEDEAAIRSITKTTLETYNYRVLTASDGIEALALYAQYQAEISVVLVDMIMPFMDGATTIRALQKINPSVKIIAISGLITNEQITQAAGVGIKAFLSKPCTAKDLLQTITSSINFPEITKRT